MLGGTSLGGDGNGEFIAATCVLFGSNHKISKLFSFVDGQCAVQFFRLGLVEGGEVLGGLCLYQVGLHANTLIGDGGGNDGVLEWGEGHVALPDGGLGKGGGVGNVANGARHFGDAQVVVVTNAEGFGCLLEFLNAQSAG